MKRIKIFLICLMLIASMPTWAQTPCQTCSTQSCSSVSLSVVYQGSTIYTNASIPWMQNMNVTVALYNAQSSQPVPALTFQTTQYCPFGSFISGINGNLQQGGNYWAMYINGAYANFGIDYQQLNAGDKISFVYTQYTTSQVSETLKKSHQSLFFTQAEKKKY